MMPGSVMNRMPMGVGFTLIVLMKYLLKTRSSNRSRSWATSSLLSKCLAMFVPRVNESSVSDCKTIDPHPLVVGSSLLNVGRATDLQFQEGFEVCLRRLVIFTLALRGDCRAGFVDLAYRFGVPSRKCHIALQQR